MTLSSYLIVILIAILPGALTLIKAKRLRRLSHARYHMAKAVTAAEKLITSNAVPVNSLRYELFRVFAQAQFDQEFTVGWNPVRKMEKQTLAFHRQLGHELDFDPESKKVVDYFLKSFVKTFRSAHPFKHFALATWVWFFHGGFRIMLGAAKLLIRGGRGIAVVRGAWRQIKQEIAEWSILFAVDKVLQRIGERPPPCNPTIEVFATSFGTLWIPRQIESGEWALHH